MGYGIQFIGLFKAKTAWEAQMMCNYVRRHDLPFWWNAHGIIQMGEKKQSWFDDAEHIPQVQIINDVYVLLIVSGGWRGLPEPFDKFVNEYRNQFDSYFIIELNELHQCGDPIYYSYVYGITPKPGDLILDYAYMYGIRSATRPPIPKDAVWQIQQPDGWVCVCPYTAVPVWKTKMPKVLVNLR